MAYAIAIPSHVANLATEVGRKKRLSCRYEWSAKQGRFMYRFFKRNDCIGELVNAARVVARMERYVVNA